MNVTYVENGDLALFDGHKFRRDKKTGYYLCSTLHVRLHRYVWEYFNGTIPEGYHVHHIDGNKENNDISNLAMMSRHEHEQLHGATMSEERRQWCRDNLARTARPKASEWHGSAAGREWHRIQGRRGMANRKEKPFICEMCGKPFTSKVTTSRFCSNPCKSKWRREAGLDNVERICQFCGNAFTANKYSTVKTCSLSCANKLKWKKWKEAAQ